MHIHIEQHIIALVETNAVEADRVDIRRILQWLVANVKSDALNFAASFALSGDSIAHVLNWDQHRGEDDNHQDRSF